MSDVWHSGLRLFDEVDGSRAFKAMNVDNAPRRYSMSMTANGVGTWSLKILW
jgi:hypothetical protein